MLTKIIRVVYYLVRERVPMGLVVVLVSILPLLVLEWRPSNAARPNQSDTSNYSTKTTPFLPVISVEERDFPPPRYTKTIKIGKNDTLSLVLKGQGAKSSNIYEALKAIKKHYDPRQIKPGQEVLVELSPQTSKPNDKIIERLVLRPDIYNEVTVERIDELKYQAKKRKIAIKRRLVKANGVISSSLYMAAIKAGVPAPVLMEFVRIYSWDVDFQRGIRDGDEFEVLFEALFTEEKTFARYGDILFGNLILQGHHKQLYRFKTSKGLIDYFDQRGQSARKALMRTPINGARLTSRFGKRRHPILGYNKMHRGVDFAAPKGTPVYAAGDGTIQYRGRKGAYGKYIRIRHNSEYQTAYAHLSRFKRRVGLGTRVRQGQIIGFVGSTGRSTGPHLHYEVLKRNRRTNPMRLRMPSGTKLRGKELQRFLSLKKDVDSDYATLLGTKKIAKSSN